ncbi:MAG: M15 family metallopeptidase [bacterium]|nr:M15 family metallopeptidase [bacterium]
MRNYKFYLFIFFTADYLCFAQTQLVNIKEFIPDIVLDIRYATPNNFTGKILYSLPDCFVAKEVAIALKKVNDDLKKQGYKLKIFDGYRPISVQKIMWDIFPNPKYIASPEKGSAHNKGYAVDVSLVDINGNDISMPTEFDEFTEKASSYYMSLPEDILIHRQILQNTMKKYGFIPSKTEWWHFFYPGYKNKPNFDIPFELLKEKK